jgi:hypothetical protein
MEIGKKKEKEQEKIRDPMAKKIRAMLNRPMPTPKLKKLYCEQKYKKRNRRKRL